MKTYHEYEASDIDWKNDKTHSFLFGQVMVIALTGFKKTPEDGDDAVAPVRRAIASFLNAAQRDGITLTRIETVPAVFRESAP